MIRLAAEDMLLKMHTAIATIGEDDGAEMLASAIGTSALELRVISIGVQKALENAIAAGHLEEFPPLSEIHEMGLRVGILLTLDALDRKEVSSDDCPDR